MALCIILKSKQHSFIETKIPMKKVMEQENTLIAIKLVRQYEKKLRTVQKLHE